MNPAIRKTASTLIALLFLMACATGSHENNTDTWNNAKWVAFEQLQDTMVLVPGVHGSGNNLGDKSIDRSVVPMFRKDFSISRKIKNASISISGLGHYELSMNGEKIGDRFLSPGWTYYQKRKLYNTYDISGHLRNGGNTIGVLVGNGFYYINRERYRKLVIAYGYPKLIFNIKLEYENGEVENIVSDGSVKVAPSPITYSSIYGGEDYSAILEQKGWNKFGFDDSRWQNSAVLDDTRETLVREEDFPLKVMQCFNPQRVFKSQTGRTIYDFGQNASAIISLKVKGNKGAQIIIRPDELINEEGNITQSSGGGPYEFNYILKGEGVEAWQPRFTYYGFRYADVEIVEPPNTDTKTEVIELNMMHTRNSAPSVGAFQCSDTLFNKIFALINWGIRSNMASVATDCPHREKLGWLEQTYLIGPSMHYNYNIHNLYKKIVNDMIDSQLETGLVPDIAPEYVYFKGGFRDSPEWGSASVIIPWQLYRWYGDIEVLEKAYPMMTRYVDYLHTKSKNHILDHGLGDWYDLGPKHPGEAQLTPKALTATAIYYYDLLILKKVASLLNDGPDVEKYGVLASKVRESFQKMFYNPETGACSTGSQTSYAMALYTGILPDQDRDMVFKNLIDSIEHNNYTLTSGDIGYHFLVRVLSENGRSDILYKMNNRNDRPGYAYQLKKGATALTESWAALPDVSNNHMMLGHLMEWFYSGLGGIYQEDNSIAYRDIIIAPKPVGNIDWVKCSFNAPQGMIVSEWKQTGKNFTLTIEVPETSSAKVIMPDIYKHSALEVVDLVNNRPVDIKIDEGTFKVSSGRYIISASLPESKKTIYVSQESGVDDNNYVGSISTPVKTLSKAYEIARNTKDKFEEYEILLKGGEKFTDFDPRKVFLYDGGNANTYAFVWDIDRKMTLSTYGSNEKAHLYGGKHTHEGGPTQAILVISPSTQDVLIENLYFEMWEVGTIMTFDTEDVTIRNIRIDRIGPYYFPDEQVEGVYVAGVVYPKNSTRILIENVVMTNCHNNYGEVGALHGFYCTRLSHSEIRNCYLKNVSGSAFKFRRSPANNVYIHDNECYYTGVSTQTPDQVQFGFLRYSGDKGEGCPFALTFENNIFHYPYCWIEYGENCRTAKAVKYSISNTTVCGEDACEDTTKVKWINNDFRYTWEAGQEEEESLK